MPLVLKLCTLREDKIKIQTAHILSKHSDVFLDTLDNFKGYKAVYYVEEQCCPKVDKHWPGKQWPIFYALWPAAVNSRLPMYTMWFLG